MSKRQGRLTDPQQFANVVIRTDADGRQVRVSDVARVELGAADYASNTYLSGEPTVILGVFQRPARTPSPRQRRSRPRWRHVEELPAGARISDHLQPDRVHLAVDRRGRDTLLEAIALVVLVVIVFLQRWRAAVIPIVAIPVSLIGTFAVLLAVGYSLNNLSLFGLVLAIGIVVDDAIVVVENVERNLARGLAGLEAATNVDGRGRRGADRDRSGAVRGVPADPVPQRPRGRVLPAVRGDHRRRRR